jgi:Zn finger protein HypA/HybF involved in hydrogenase expression
LQFIQTQLEQELLEEKKEALREDKAAMWCRHCQTNDHWSRNCPNKVSFDLKKSLFVGIERRESGDERDKGKCSGPF